MIPIVCERLPEHPSVLFAIVTVMIDEAQDIGEQKEPKELGKLEKLKEGAVCFPFFLLFSSFSLFP